MPIVAVGFQPCGRSDLPWIQADAAHAAQQHPHDSRIDVHRDAHFASESELAEASHEYDSNSIGLAGGFALSLWL